MINIDHQIKTSQELIDQKKDGQELNDQKRDGKARPWKEKKIRSLIISDSFHRLGEIKRSTRIKFCGTILEFTREVESGFKYLTGANFCRERLCPMCQWRRSLRVFYEVSGVMDELQLKNNSLVPIFLTLTLRNCQPENIGGTLDSIFNGWIRFTKQANVARIIKGWFRALEITYNKQADEFHPHIHALLLVDKNYFKSDDYLKTNEWVQVWKKALGIEYDPICDVRKVKNEAGRRKHIAEVAKYTLKDSEITNNAEPVMDHLVKILSAALKGRRLYAFGGKMKETAKELGASEPGEDLIKTGDTIRQDVATVIDRYSWRFGFSTYKLMRPKKNIGAELAAETVTP